MHGVEGIRTSAEGVDGPQLRDLLKEVHPEMVALHVDGYDTVGALRAVVAWAGGVDVKGSSTWDVGRSCAFDEEALALHAEAWHAAMPAFQVWGVDAAKWQDRGMLPVDALGAMMSAAKAGLNVLLERGWSLESAAKHATMRVAMGTDVLSSVAMVRAARAMWHRLLSEMGCPNAGALRLEAQTSTLGLHAEGGRDALLSNTVAAYAAVVGGVDGLEVRPHDFRSHDRHDAQGVEHTRALRWARNIQHVLREEAGLGAHADAMKGSHALEALTRQMAEQAWTRFETLEAAGGWRACDDLIRQWTVGGAACPLGPSLVRVDRHGPWHSALGAKRGSAFLRVGPPCRGALSRALRGPCLAAGPDPRP